MGRSRSLWGTIEHPYVFDAFPFCTSFEEAALDFSWVPLISLSNALLAYPNLARGRMSTAMTDGRASAWVPMSQLRAQHFVSAFGRYAKRSYYTSDREQHSRFKAKDPG